MIEPARESHYADSMMYSRMNARGAVDLVLLLCILFPLWLGHIGVDAFHAMRAAQTNEYDYEGEVRRIAVEPFGGDEQRIREAEAVWRDLDEAARLHRELLDGFHDAEADEGWYDTYYRHYAVCNYEEFVAEIRERYADYGAEYVAEEIQRLGRQREWAGQLIEMLPESGIIALLERAADAERSIMPLLDEEQNLTSASAGQDHRALFRCLDAAKEWAGQREDWEAYVAYERLSLALARHWMQQPDSLAWVQGGAMYSGTLRVTREQLARGSMPAEVIRELQRVADEQVLPGTISHVLAEQRAETLGAFDMYYSEGGIAYIDDAGRFWNLLALALPRRSTGERVVNQFYEEFDRYAALTIAERLEIQKPWAWSYVRPRSMVSVILQLPLVGVMQTASMAQRLVQSSELWEMERLSLRVLMAIELYKAERGALPADLADLVTDYLDTPPRDPFDPEGGLLRYRVFESPDALGRSYLLYSVGRDMTDNGGHLEADGWPKQALQDRYPGTDYIMNDLKHPEESE